MNPSLPILIHSLIHILTPFFSVCYFCLQDKLIQFLCSQLTNCVKINILPVCEGVKPRIMIAAITTFFLSTKSKAPIIYCRCSFHCCVLVKCVRLLLLPIEPFLWIINFSSSNNSNTFFLSLKVCSVRTEPRCRHKSHNLD